MKSTFIFPLLLIVSCLSSSAAQNKTQSKAQKIDSVLVALEAAGQLNGCVLVAEKGKVVYKNCFGLANHTTGAVLDENSMFELASVSKQFTAMGIMLLHDKGKLSLDDLLEKHIPELAAYKGVTLRHLVHHTSGLPDYMELLSEHFDKSGIATNKDVIDYLAKYQPAAQFEPNTQFEYSNTGYVLLASVIERVSGMSFAAFLDQYIFKPLKMERSMVYNRRYAPKHIDNYATGYVYSSYFKRYMVPDSMLQTRMVVWLDGIVGDGCVNATVHDLLKWDRALYTNKLLSAKNRRALFEPITLANGTRTQYAFGWATADYKYFGQYVNHSGSWPGYRTFIERHPESDKTIIFLQNHDELAMKAIDDIRLILFDKPLAAEKLKKTIALADATAKKYTGLYRVNNLPILVVNKPDGLYLMTDGKYSKMQFTTETAFFNLGFPTDKQFLLDKSGNVTGYSRAMYGNVLPSADKIVSTDTLQASVEFFNKAGWGMIENGMLEQAASLLERGMELHPGYAQIAVYLAHSYLFNKQVDKAFQLYKNVLEKKAPFVDSREALIQSDFAKLKTFGYDMTLMHKMLDDLKLKKPTGF
jgi:CubicO group peptidase (beta-lactamase class C family)